MPACVEITPFDVDFGTVQTGCRSVAKPFTIRNVCPTPVTISALGVAATEFSRSALTLPLVLSPGQQQNVNITFTPTTNGVVSSSLVVGANHSSATFVYQTAVVGTGASSGANQDRFVIPRKVDVVLVVDDSCSMFDKQVALGANANAFLSYAISAGVDFNLGITTTDTAISGGFILGTTGTRVLRSTTPNLLQVFNQHVNVGTSGSGLEEMFRPALSAVTQPTLTSTNTGFLRADANLSVLAFTDATEQGTDTVASMVTQFLRVKGLKQRNRFSFSFVRPIATQPPTGCVYDSAQSNDQRQVEMIRDTGGVSAEICDVLNPTVWRPEATRVGQAVFGGRATWFLTAPPVPASAAGLNVTLNGVTVPEVARPSGVRNWSYDGSRNAVVFEANSLPAPGQTVGVDYTVACMP